MYVQMLVIPKGERKTAFSMLCLYQLFIVVDFISVNNSPLRKQEMEMARWRHQLYGHEFE